MRGGGEVWDEGEAFRSTRRGAAQSPLSLQGEGPGVGARAGGSAASGASAEAEIVFGPPPSIPPPEGEGRVSPGSIRRARRLRRQATVAERNLWKRLRGNRLEGLHFRRQHPIGPYVVDFCCVPKRLVIELDGYFHTDPLRMERDEARAQWLRERGYRILRFQNDQVFDAVEAVLVSIQEAALR